MKVFIIGANGRSGSALVKEALNQHHDVTAIVRGELKENYNGKVKVIKKDLYDLTFEDLKKADVVIDAFGVFDSEKLYMHQTSLEHLTKLLNGKNIRLMVVGGAASLYTDKNHTKTLLDTPTFPKEIMPLASSMAKAFEKLKKVKDLKWTYLSPAVTFDATKPGTGHYTLGGDSLILNQKGESYVTYDDFAKAMIDEIKNQKFINKRFTVVGE